MAAGPLQLAIALPGLLIAIGAGPTAAEIATDGTTGPRAQLHGPEFAIGADLGTRAGRNLFHSFERFSLAAGERATFSGPAAIRNIISRVTGGEASQIDGTIASTIPGADFYILNPRGVVFGPNASLDVSGSFHVSTADELRFADRAAFSARDPTASSFAVARPEAFGFLGQRPGKIMLDRGTLVPGSGGALSLVAGDVRLRGGTVFGDSVLVATQRAEGTVPLGPRAAPVVRDGRVALTPARGRGASILSSGPGGGTIRIEGGVVTLDRSNLFDANPGELDETGGIAVGARRLTVVGPNAGVQTQGTGRGRAGPITVVAPDLRVAAGTISSGAGGAAPAGDLTIRSDRVVLESGGTISAPVGFATRPDATGGTITLHADEALSVGDGSRIFADTFGRGDGGAVVIEAGRLEVRTAASSPPFSAISASTFAAGHAGSLAIAAGEVLVDRGFISAGVAPRARGAGGDIAIAADRITVANGGLIDADTLGAGPGGSIAIRAADAIEVASGATIGAFAGASGRGGRIALAAPRLRLDGGRINASTQGSGNAGSIAIRAGLVEMRDEGQINSSTFAGGAGGSILVDARRLVADATRPDTVLATGIAASATDTSSGPAGDVRVTAGEVRVVNGAEISSVARGRGRGGNLTITARRLVIDDAQIVATTEREAQASAAAGSVVVRAESLEIRDRGLLSAGTSGPGDGGNLLVEAARIVIDGAEEAPSELFTGIESAAQRGSTGRSGNIVVRAGVLEIRNDAGIANSTLGPGDGGRLRVEATAIRLRDNGNIVSSSFSDAPGAGDAGELTVVAQEQLHVDNAFIGTESVAAGGGQIALEVGELLFLGDAGEISSSVFGGAGTSAGDITIDPRFIVLDGGRIITQAKAGRGGNIRITADNLILSPDSVINAEAGEEGIDGTVVVSTPEADLSSGLVVLEGALLDATSQLRERCGARRDIGASSFTGVGRGGLPPSPDGPLAGAYLPAAPSAAGLRERAALAATLDRPAAIAVPCRGAP